MDGNPPENGNHSDRLLYHIFEKKTTTRHAFILAAGSEHGRTGKDMVLVILDQGAAMAP